MSKFLEVKCQCGGKQIIFSKPAGEIKCTACSSILASSTGGKAEIQAKITKELD